jgi:hypothetical protein
VAKRNQVSKREPPWQTYYRLVGICAGKILSGEKPADLSVMQSTKFDFSQRRICL